MREDETFSRILFFICVALFIPIPPTISILRIRKNRFFIGRAIDKKGKIHYTIYSGVKNRFFIGSKFTAV